MGATVPRGEGCAWLKSFFMSPCVQALAIYALLIAPGLLRGDGSPIHEPAGKAEATENKRVRVVTRRDGDVTHFLVENLERTEVTMTFNFDLGNLKSTVDFPFTATIPPQQTKEAFSLSPINPDEPWNYSFTNYHNLGSSEAIHDDSYRYSLPYAPGSSFRVSQGYDGKFSHKGSNRFAIDWRMPEGTPVHAARGGFVVKVKDDSDRGGGDVKFDTFNNYVLIRHDDGTLGQYCHLKKGGVKVREGDVVNDGDLLAHSGNTGFSSGPHLHFSVFKTKNGKERESIPVQFRTAATASITLEAGQRYIAAPTIQRAESENVAHSQPSATSGG